MSHMIGPTDLLHPTPAPYVSVSHMKIRAEFNPAIPAAVFLSSQCAVILFTPCRLNYTNLISIVAPYILKSTQFTRQQMHYLLTHAAPRHVVTSPNLYNDVILPSVLT